MVERQRSDLTQPYPSRLARVVPSPRRTPSPSHPKRDGRGRAARVSIRPGINPDEPIRTGVESGLLFQLPDHGRFNGLAELDEPAREGPLTVERRTAPADEEDAPLPDPDRVDRQRRARVLWHSRPSPAEGGIRGSGRA